MRFLSTKSKVGVNQTARRTYESGIEEETSPYCFFKSNFIKINWLITCCGTYQSVWVALGLLLAAEEFG